MNIRAVIDSSVLVPFESRKRIQKAAKAQKFTAIWSPWIIAEVNRVLTWRWIKDPPSHRTYGDITDTNEKLCALIAKKMMSYFIPIFELVDPRPPYPEAWPELKDEWDIPIWATAKESNAQYVVSENTRDFPPKQPDGRHMHEGIEYLTARDFLTMLGIDWDD